MLMRILRSRKKNKTQNTENRIPRTTSEYYFTTANSLNALHHWMENKKKMNYSHTYYTHTYTNTNIYLYKIISQLESVIQFSSS